MENTMKAVVLSEPGPVDNLVITDLPIPEPRQGWVRIAVKAFGLNRSELQTRLGLATATLAKDLGAIVLSTTRQPDRVAALKAHSVDYPILDTGHVAAEVRRIFPAGVDAALELVGTPTLPDTLASTRVHGVVCFTGMLSNQWLVRDFYPISYLPKGVRLTAYGGVRADLPAAILQRFLDGIAAGPNEHGHIYVT